MTRFKVVKRDGRKEYFDEEKLVAALKRAGADDVSIKEVLLQVAHKLRPGMPTNKIYNLARRYLRKIHPGVASRYSLKEAIFRLGPSGYDFEKYIALLLREHRYKTNVPGILQGACISHEVDVIARKDSKSIFIECKLRKNNAVYVDTQAVLATWARWIDLRNGAKLGECEDFQSAWMVTNGRFSNQALDYGVCQGMNMVSWNTPRAMPLPAYIDKINFYPITVMHSISNSYLNAFSRHNIILLKEVAIRDVSTLARLTGITKPRLEEVSMEAITILGSLGILTK